MAKVLLVFGITAVLLLAASPLVAAPTVFATRQNGFYSGVGGEFTLIPSDVPGLANGAPVQTFCVEYNEYIWLNRTYQVVVNTRAIQGGAGPAGDLLDPRTAFLYNAFADGALTAYGYDYTPGPARSASAGALQEVIWYLEGERGMTWSDGSLQDCLLDAAQACGWSDIGNVRVLNLYDGGCLRQDQLVRVAVPDPAALLLGGMGVAAVGWLRRRHAL